MSGNAAFPRQMVIRFDDYVEVHREYVASLAHRLWVSRGCPQGSPEVDWFAAELKVDQELLDGLELGLPA